jgi:hypothetical protein
MCNDYEREIRWTEYCALMQAVELGIRNHPLRTAG